MAESFFAASHENYRSCNSSSMASMAASLHGTSSYANPFCMANNIACPSSLFFIFCRDVMFVFFGNINHTRPYYISCFVVANATASRAPLTYRFAFFLCVNQSVL